MSDDKMQDRLNALVDRKMYDADPWYHAMISVFRSWLLATEMAMEDEEIAEGTRDRVLNRLVYATPNGVDAYERIARQEEDLQRIMTQAPGSFFVDPGLFKP